MDFRARVVDHYRSRGYQVRDAAKVRGQSGNVYAVDLVAQGPLGNIVVTFGGTDGLDEADVAHIRRVAKEVGATPVAAAETIEPLVRRLAARESVVVLDRDLPVQLQEPEVVPEDDVKRWAQDHPWPGSDKAGTGGSLASVALDDLLAPASSAPPVKQGPPKQAARGAAPAAPSPQQPSVLPQPTGQPGPPTGRFSWLSQGGYSFEDARPVTVQPDAPTRIARESRDEVLQRVRERVDGDRSPRTGPPPAVDRDLALAQPEARHVAPGRTAEVWWIVRFAVGGAVAAGVWWALSHIT